MSRGLSTNRRLTAKASCLAQAGIDFAARYYSAHTHQPEKALTADEAKTLCDADIQLVVVYEDGPTDSSYFSKQRGQQDGQAALAAANGITQPLGTTIYFAVDYDASVADVSGPIADYFDGVAAAIHQSNPAAPPYLIGVYGSGRCCKFLKDNGKAIKTWLAESTGWAGYATFAEYDIKQKKLASAVCGLDSGGAEDNEGKPSMGAFTVG